MLVFAGVAAWEVVVTFDFDWSIMTGQRKWRWPMAIYFICRISLVLAIWTAAVQLNGFGTSTDCMALYLTNQSAEVIGNCASSLILALRAYAVWGQDRRVGMSLLALWAGQIGIWTYMLNVWVHTWISSNVLCVPSRAPKLWLYITIFSYTVALDFFILSLMAIRLFRHRSSGISTLMLRDGIAYCIVSVLANGTEIIFAALHLNDVLNVIAIPVAGVVSTIAATRVYRHTYEAGGPLSRRAVRTTGGAITTIAFRDGTAVQTFSLVDMEGRMQTFEAASVGRHEECVERDSELDDVKDAPCSMQLL